MTEFLINASNERLYNKGFYIACFGSIKAFYFLKRVFVVVTQ